MILHHEKKSSIHSSELVCGEQEEQETVVLARCNYDGVGLTEKLWCYWTSGAESLSWGSYGQNGADLININQC